jgi:hypothetical protein
MHHKIIMKKLIFLLLVILFPVSLVYGQACGGSTRTILLKHEKGEKPPKKVSYELFYLAPKNTGADLNDYERTTKFLSKFLYDNENAEKKISWGGYDEENPFISVAAERAEKYIESYKLEDFKDFYTNRFYVHHLRQLNGKFTDGTLKLETRETDVVPFIMRIKAGNYETLYFVSSFLGGCFEGKVQTIEMKAAKK